MEPRTPLPPRGLDPHKLPLHIPHHRLRPRRPLQPGRGTDAVIGDEVEGDEEREVRRQDPAAHRGREAGARAVARVRHPGEVPHGGPAVRGEVDEGCGGMSAG